MPRNLGMMLCACAIVLCLFGNPSAQLVEKWDLEHNLGLKSRVADKNEGQLSGTLEGDLDGDGTYETVAYAVRGDEINVEVRNSLKKDMGFSTVLISKYGPSVVGAFLRDVDEDGRDELIFHYEMNSVVYELGSAASGIELSESGVAAKTELAQIDFVPSASTKVISYQIESTGESPVHVDLSIYNVRGQKLITLVSARQSTGSYTADWDAADYPAGVYFCRLETSMGFAQSRKLILLR
jgi:hypothetical protein